MATDTRAGYTSLAEMLDAQPSCPICGCIERTPCTAPAGEPSRYSRAAADAVGIAVRELWAAMPLHTCTRCGSHWHDPWFTTGASAWLYGVASTTHQYGMRSARWWFEKHDASWMASRRTLWSMLRARLAGPVRYAELNCPFAGLAFDEVDFRRGDRSRPAFLRAAERIRAAAATGERAGVRFTEEGGFLSERTLLLRDSPLCWGDACEVGPSLHCRDLATAFFSRVITLDAVESTGERFDLVGAYLMIDHQPDPLRTTERLLAIGGCVILEIHVPGWTDAQHLYGINPSGFCDVLRAAGTLHVHDLTGRVRRHGITDPPLDSVVLALSRSDDLAWLA